jgi:hypothetical protein
MTRRITELGISISAIHITYHNDRGNNNIDNWLKSSIFIEVDVLLTSGRMLDPSAAENQMSSISTFHPVSRIQGTTSTLQPVINGADLDQISMKPPTRAPTNKQRALAIEIAD